MNERERTEIIELVTMIGVVIIVVLAILFLPNILFPFSNYEPTPRESLYFYDTGNQSSASYLVEVQVPTFQSGDWYEVAIYIYPMDANVSSKIIHCTLKLGESEHSQIVAKDFVATHQGQSELTCTAMGWLSFHPEDTKRFSDPNITLLLRCEGHEQSIYLSGGFQV